MLGAASRLVTSTTFQSTPLVVEGRCSAFFFARIFSFTVSIHAPRCRRAMPLAAYTGARMDLFQSTPLVVEGRCHSQHSPENHVGQVSIHAPRCRRAMQATGICHRSGPASFNPRPSLSKGDALGRGQDGCVEEEFQSTPLVVEGRCKWAKKFHVPFNEFQSTPLVVEGRCEPVGVLQITLDQFQSTPLVVEGRCHSQHSPENHVGQVSIHAPRCRRAMRTAYNSFAKVCYQFQSTPLVVEGRCGTIRRVHTFGICFNPRPSLSKGDALALFVAKGPRVVSIHAPRCRRAMQIFDAIAIRDDCVSIHAPRCRRAMRTAYNSFAKVCYQFQSTPLVVEGRCGTIRRVHTFGICFNPRPSLSKGDALALFVAKGPRVVSIHAPRCRRAMQIFDAIAIRDDCVSIHAPRCRRAMHSFRSTFPSGKWFQSTPLVVEGRCAQAAGNTALAASFNPRPSLSKGDASPVSTSPSYRCVSIHAPRCRRAMRLQPRPTRKTSPVSIHAPRCRRAMHATWRVGSRAGVRFQSTPLVVEGRCRGALRFHGCRLHVSIHAPRCRRAMPIECGTYGNDFMFQSTPLVVEGRCLYRQQHPEPSLGQFQSTPLVVEGRCDIDTDLEGQTNCFNPRPSLSKGDAHLLELRLGVVMVSIHAPRCRRAMHEDDETLIITDWFQSTPLVVEGRCL